MFSCTGVYGGIVRHCLDRTCSHVPAYTVALLGMPVVAQALLPPSLPKLLAIASSQPRRLPSCARARLPPHTATSMRSGQRLESAAFLASSTMKEQVLFSSSHLNLDLTFIARVLPLANEPAPGFDANDSSLPCNPATVRCRRVHLL